MVYLYKQPQQPQVKVFDKKTDIGLKYEILNFDKKEFVKSGVTSDYFEGKKIEQNE